MTSLVQGRGKSRNLQQKEESQENQRRKGIMAEERSTDMGRWMRSKEQGGMHKQEEREGKGKCLAEEETTKEILSIHDDLEEEDDTRDFELEKEVRGYEVYGRGRTGRTQTRKRG